MKYTKTNKPLECMMTNSTCYKETNKMTVKGVLWHSTGANNPNLCRYVQPDDNAPNRQALLNKIGRNSYGNDWNHIYVEAGLNAWVGKLDDGTVSTVQTMPWDYKPWGCGSGRNGSCNNGWIQFEICEDGLNDKAYFEKVYKEACELTAYLCTIYNLDPMGWTDCSGTRCPVILCHADSCNLGLGSNHGDVLHWFPKFGKNMDTVRADVAALMKAATRKTGDVNNDGKVNQADAQKILDHTAGKTKLTGDALKVADYNKDGKVDTADARAILSASGAPAAPAQEMYRVRKTWADAASQKGAFTDLANAKACCDKAGAGYEVYNSKGTVVYAGKSAATSAPAAKPAPALKVGDVCKIKAGSKFTTGDTIPDWVINSTLYIREVSSDTIVFSTQKTGAITGATSKSNLVGQTTSQPAASVPAAPALKVGNTCKLKAGAKFTTGDAVPQWVMNSTLYVREIGSDTVVISTLKTGDITGAVEKKWIEGATAAFAPYKIIVNTAKLNVRAGAGSNYAVQTVIKQNEVYTIVEEKNGWGKLKSGAGWIAL